MNKDFVTARDLLANTFSITVHRSILERFAKAIRQRQVILAQYGIPPEVVSVVVPVTPSESPPSPMDQDYLEALAYCFYHFISFKYWEQARSTKLWDAAKDDFEDNLEKRVSCFISKLTVCLNCVVLRATVGHKVCHTAVWCAPSGAIEGIVPARDAAKPTRRLLSTSDKKFISPTEHQGTWSINVDIRRPIAAQAHTAFSAQQFADVAEILVSIKPRHELNVFQVSVLCKLPSVITAAVPDDVEIEDEVSDPVDDLFVAPVRCSPPRVINGVADPVPLPRNPKQYSLPENESAGPVIPPYKPIEVAPPTVLKSCTSYTVTPLHLKANQSLGGKEKDPVTNAEVPVYTQFITMGLTVLNRTDKPLVFPPPVCKCVNGEGVTALEAHCTKWDGRDGILTVEPFACVNVSVRAEFAVKGEAGGDNFERTFLDPATFPQPASFHFTLLESHSSEQTIVALNQYNPDRDLPTKESYMADVHKGIPAEDCLICICADDTDRFRRTFASVFLDRSENHLVVARRNSRMYFPLQKLQSIGYECLMSGQSEYELTGFYDGVCRAWALMSQDVHPTMVYGIKLQISTPTSVTTEYCHVIFGGDNWIAGQETISSPRSVANSSVAEAKDAIIKSGNRGPFNPELPPTPTHVATPDPRLVSTDSREDFPVGMPLRSVSTSMGYNINYHNPIGSGAFGTVYKAFDVINGRTVAVKESNVGRAISAGPTSTTNSTSSSASSDQREFEVLVKLSHPNIVKVYEMDFVKESGVFRVFMEWVPSGSVASVISQSRFRLHENVVRAYARDALQGLAYLHQRNILHLDVKPHNMLVSHEGHVKLADFGTTLLLSQAMTSISTHRVVGTPAYMAPEIISAGKYYRGSDIWAWAASVVEMATGKHPWHHLSEEKRNNSLPLMFHIASAKSPNHAPLIPDNLSQDLKDILNACFSPSLSLRPSADSLLSTEYFSRETLPLDVEPMEAFYELSKAHKDDAANGEAQTLSTTNESWTSVGSTC